MSRSPIELLGAILDEVEGLRQTDARSHLPVPLMLELREAMSECTGSTRGVTNMLRSADDLQGHTIAHVFDCWVKRGDLVLITTSGAFLVFETEVDYDDEATLNVRHDVDATISEYLEPHALMLAGIINANERAEIERREAITAAEDQEKRARAQLKRAEEALAKARGLLDPAPASAAPSRDEP